MLSTELQHQLSQFIAPITQIQPVSGGDISRAYKITTQTDAWLLKLNTQVPTDFFAAEADGLQRLRSANVFAVPQVRAWDLTWILIEWYEARGRYNAVDLGTQLALLHAVHAHQYGYERNNYIGSLAQPNTWQNDWADFWRDYRLLPQIHLADAAQRLNPQRSRLLDTLCSRCTELLNHHPTKSLLHGDLWSGNVITDPNNQPALIDPAVSYGDPETDLAFAALFGGFGANFEQAYSAVEPLPYDMYQRRPLYQLYWLLVHLTLFGESYGSAVDRILLRYVG